MQRTIPRENAVQALMYALRPTITGFPSTVQLVALLPCEDATLSVLPDADRVGVVTGRVMISWPFSIRAVIDVAPLKRDQTWKTKSEMRLAEFDHGRISPLERGASLLRSGNPSNCAVLR